MSNEMITITLSRETILELIAAAGTAQTYMLLQDRDKWMEFGEARHDAYLNAKNELIDAAK